MSNTTSKRRTITLTDARPVTINEDLWPLVASAKWFDGQHESQANSRASLRVREHADGRRIVYGVSSSDWQGAESYAGGYLVPAGSDADLIDAINLVGEAVGHNLAAECIADLPSTDLE